MPSSTCRRRRATTYGRTGSFGAGGAAAAAGSRMAAATGTLRPTVAMELLETNMQYGPDGEEMCLEMNVPHFGEEQSGDELEVTTVQDLGWLGFEQAEGEPALHYFQTEDGRVHGARSTSSGAGS